MSRQVAETDQKRQEPVPEKLVAGHVAGTAEAVEVHLADTACILNTILLYCLGGACGC